MKDYSYDSGKDDPAPSTPSGPSFDDDSLGKGDGGGGGKEDSGLGQSSDADEAIWRTWLEKCYEGQNSLTIWLLIPL